MTRVLSIAFLLVFVHLNLFGQTTRYWSLNFASEPSILAGAVIGGYAENQAAYYNPALIAESQYNNISLSGEIVELNFYKAKNAFGEGLDLNFTNVSLVPSFVSVYLKPRRNKDLAVQLAILTRDNNEFDVDQSMVGEADIYSSISGLERFSVNYESYLKYLDIWVGGGAAYTVNEKLSIGASVFVRVKSLNDKLTRTILVTPDQPSDSIQNSSAREIARTRLTNYKIQSKIGIQYKLPRWRFGLNVTLPSLLVAGWGRRYREVGYENIYSEEQGGFLPDAATVGYGDDLDAVYKDPLSIAVGFNYSRVPGRDMLGVSMEYFHRIPVFKMVNAAGSPGNELPPGLPESPNADFLSVWYGANPVFNVALGYRKYINEGLTLLGGIRTDFDYLKNVDFTGTSNEYNNFIKFYWDVIHVTGGARFNLLRHRFVIGMQYSYGRQDNMRQISDFVPSVHTEGRGLPLEKLDDRSVIFSQNGISVFFGFIFNFLDKTDNLEFQP